MEQVHTEDPECLLLVQRVRVEQVRVEDDFGGQIMRVGLKPHAHPAMTVLGPTVPPGRHGVGEHEERGRVTTPCFELLEQLCELVLEHRLEALAADIASGGAVEAIADRHVIRRDGLGDPDGGGADREVPPRHS